MLKLISNISIRALAIFFFFLIVKLLSMVIFPEMQNSILFIFSAIVCSFFEFIGVLKFYTPYDDK